MHRLDRKLSFADHLIRPVRHVENERLSVPASEPLPGHLNVVQGNPKMPRECSHLETSTMFFPFVLITPATRWME
jgi:hypothetical protein